MLFSFISSQYFISEVVIHYQAQHTAHAAENGCEGFPFEAEG
jgi:hypothetical protein